MNEENFEQNFGKTYLNHIDTPWGLATIFWSAELGEKQVKTNFPESARLAPTIAMLRAAMLELARSKRRSWWR